jgi:hypothetical protein
MPIDPMPEEIGPDWLGRIGNIACALLAAWIIYGVFVAGGE